jgi:hypothetical protein
VDLIDFRGKITPRSHSVLTAIARATGKDLAEVAREWLDEMAETRIHEATLIVRLTRGEGHAGEPEGKA